MKKAIELARSRERRSEELAADSTQARDRLALYKARAYGPQMTSPARMRELERSADLASQRLQHFQSEPDASEPEAGEEPHEDEREARP